MDFFKDGPVQFNGMSFNSATELCDIYKIDTMVFASREDEGLDIGKCVLGGRAVYLRGTYYPNIAPLLREYELERVAYEMRRAEGKSIEECVSILYGKYGKTNNLRATFRGVLYNTEVDICKAYKISQKTFTRRKARRWDLESCVIGKATEKFYGVGAVMKRTYEVISFKFNNKSYTSEVDLCNYYGKDYQAYTNRKDDGASMVECLFGVNERLRRADDIVLIGEGLDTKVLIIDKTYCAEIKVNYTNYIKRRARGVSINDCIVAGIKNKAIEGELYTPDYTRKFVEFEGKTYNTQVELCRAYGVNEDVFYKRKCYGHSMYYCIYGVDKKEDVIEFEGKHYNRGVHVAKAYGVSYASYCGRKKAGWDMHDCIYGRPRKVRCRKDER